ncbi:hypothetical protein JCM19235_1218 [Vibrio maritimus]|uniref:Uncharacterized protein n=1 Tax=Vibrio maritimus TaxID=990268 RepID=A0A090SUB2_9VIBR|nr:hypothetical protein JCM19235_1218 [Vibrio maritimus]
MDVSNFLNDKSLSFIKPKARTNNREYRTYIEAKHALNVGERDFLNGLEMDGNVRYFYVQGFKAGQYDRNPYQAGAMLAFHAWSAGHYDKWRQ